MGEGFFRRLGLLIFILGALGLFTGTIQWLSVLLLFSGTCLYLFPDKEDR